MTSPETVRTRFAPSPSGDLHVGGARTALFCWVYARRKNGKMILRIEDTDQKRSSDSASLGFLTDLEWMGICWDEGPEHAGCGGGAAGPYFQAQRLDLYNAAFEQLLASGAAYRAFETPEELDAARADAAAKKQSYRYNRAALQLDEETIQRYVAEGRPSVIRFKVPDDAVITIVDDVLGNVDVATEQLDDFVICKADGYPTYHFAVVVDDELMGVTHVIRGQEHLNNTPKHMLLQDALGYRRPRYAHISLIFNSDGSKMSKRDKDKTLRTVVRDRGVEDVTSITADRWSWWQAHKDHQLDPAEADALARELDVALPEINIDDFRRAGYLPEVMINYLALLGWSPGGDVEKFDLTYLLEHFDLSRIIKSPARFDRDKLLAFNLDAIQNLAPDEWSARLTAHARRYHPDFVDALGEGAFRKFAEANQDRSKTLEDPIASGRFFIAADDEITYESSKAVRKALINGDPNGCEHLRGMLPILDGLSEWSVETIETAVRQHADEHAGEKLGKVAQPLRIAVTGGTISPAIFQTLAILGQQSVCARMVRCLEIHSAPVE